MHKYKFFYGYILKKKSMELRKGKEKAREAK